MKFLAAATTVVLLMAPTTTGHAAPATAPLVSPTNRDGRRDFDFLFGKWRTHYRLLRERLRGNHDWYSCNGTSVIRAFWGGSGNLEDGDLHCPRRYIGGMTLRLYNARTHQWALWWGTRDLGLVPPPQIGHFDSSGVGDFFARDTYRGKPIIVRFRWSTVKGEPHFEQAFSPDDGKSWETNWTTDYTRANL